MVTAASRDKSLRFEPVQHAGHGSRIDTDLARAACHRMGMALGDHQQRHPLRRGQVVGLQFGIQVTQHDLIGQLDQIADRFMVPERHRVAEIELGDIVQGGRFLERGS